MKQLIITALFAIAIASSVSATVTIGFETGTIRDSSGVAVPLGTVGIIVVDSLGNGFVGTSGGAMTAGSYPSLVGLQLTAGQSIGDDVILGVFQATDVDVDGSPPIDRVFSGNLLSGYVYAGNIGAGDKLAMYWFPGVTTPGATLTTGQTQAAFYRTDTADLASNSDMGFVLPNDGFSGNLFIYDSTITGNIGSASPSQFSAVDVSGVPEPSRLVLLGLGGLGLLLRRRRS